MKWIEVHDVEIEVAALDEIGPEWRCLMVSPFLAIVSELSLVYLIKISGNNIEHFNKDEIWEMADQLEWIKNNAGPTCLSSSNSQSNTIWKLIQDAHYEIVKELLK